MASPRELWVVFHDTSELELVVDGMTTDDALLNMFHSIHGRESDAWLLSIMGQLPDWWRLIDTIRTRGMTGRRNQSAKPRDDAQLRWKETEARERVTFQRGWRVIQGRDGGGNVIYRVPNDPERIFSTPVGEIKIEPIEIPEQRPESGLIIPERRLIRV